MIVIGVLPIYYFVSGNPRHVPEQSSIPAISMNSSMPPSSAGDTASYPRCVRIGGENYSEAVSLDAAYPLEIVQPLDIGPDEVKFGGDGRKCLRALQGASEIQERGEGIAKYCFEIAKDGYYETYFRVRWVNDKIGSVDCNNSWFARVDDSKAFVVGNHGGKSTWSWVSGSRIRLTKGIHWLWIELREDGALMDRIVFSPKRKTNDAFKESLTPVVFTGAEGLSSPNSPQDVVDEVNLFAIQTDSRVIGKGHNNAILIGASFQGKSLADKQFSYSLHPSVKGILATASEGSFHVSEKARVYQKKLSVNFKPGLLLQNYSLVLKVFSDTGKLVYSKSFSYIMPYTWAFIMKTQIGRDEVSSRSIKMKFPDTNPFQFINFPDPATLFVKRPGSSKKWIVVEDGSCYSWNGAIDLLKVFGKKYGCCAYAVSWINAQSKLVHRSFYFAADDSGWLWMNGNFLVLMPMSLPLEANRLFVSASLHKGMNPLVVKVYQKQKYWRFRLDVIDWHYQGRRGDTIRGVKLKGWPVKRPENLL